MFLGILGAFVTLLVIGAALGGRNKEPTASSQNPPAAGVAAPSSAAPAGHTAVEPHRVVEDGDFAFRFLRMTCGPAAEAAVYGDSEFTGGLPPGTKECLVRLRVTNDKDEAQTYFASNQYAIDIHGRQLTADENSAFLPSAHDGTQLNPGVSLTAEVPFNLPATDRIVALDLHDSAFSGGVRVHL